MVGFSEEKTWKGFILIYLISVHCMRYDYSKHSLEKMALRGISQEQVDMTIKSFDKCLTESEGQYVYQKVFSLNKESYLIRVFINKDKDPPLIKTVYKTSKIDKYQ
jgi:hypothetical protein